MAELPSHPEPLCFDGYLKDFQEKDFKVDQFIGECRKRVTIECLRKDLDSYYRTLKSAMVELINKDYADFVNLSSNLVGMDKAIEDLMTPLSQLEGELLDIKMSMESAIKAVDGKLAERTQIRKEMEMLQRLMDIMASIEKLERLLKIKRHSSAASSSVARTDEMDELSKKAEFAAMVMERIASEFNKLQYSVNLTDHPLVEDSKPHIAVITSTLQSRLEESLHGGLASKDRSVLIQCLQTYASINRCQAAEMLVGSLVVYPSLDEIITNKKLLGHPSGLSGLYGDILDCIKEKCGLLLQITQATGQSPATVKGYDFLVNSVWPQVVSLLEVKVAVIFAQGNPDTFHKNYTTSMKFVKSFEELCGTRASVKALRTHPSLNTFMSKWSLPVYFQIRFQEIAGGLESSLALPLVRCTQESSDSTPRAPPYQLDVFHCLEKCIRQCWDDNVFIAALVHRFWKLTLQFLIRTSVWLQHLSTLPLSKVPTGKKSSSQDSSGSSDNQESLKLEDLFDLIHDCELLKKQVFFIFTGTVKNLITLPDEKKNAFEGALLEASDSIATLVPKFADLITDGIAALCKQELESAHILPRLYRRTNKETPSRPSSYVIATLQPLETHSRQFPSHYKLQWTGDIIIDITKRYSELGSELLTSVQRTEESLLKLKSYRKSLTPSSSGNGGMTDDNKIRLQLALDIEEFTVQVLSIHPASVNLAEFKHLMEQGQVAKTTALSNSS